MARHLHLSIRPPPFISTANLCRLGRTIGQDILEFLLVLLVADVREDLRHRVERFPAKTSSASDGQVLHDSKQVGDEAADAVSLVHVDCQ